jgi:dihydroneopterin aldolase
MTRMDRIRLMGMRFAGHLGVSADERAEPQALEVDLEVEADLSRAGRSDDLADTVDYGPLVALVRARVEERSYRLLEALAQDIASGALDAAPASSAVTVRVRKLAVPLDADIDHAEVEIRRSRS